MPSPCRVGSPDMPDNVTGTGIARKRIAPCCGKQHGAHREGSRDGTADWRSTEMSIAETTTTHQHTAPSPLRDRCRLCGAAAQLIFRRHYLGGHGYVSYAECQDGAACETRWHELTDTLARTRCAGCFAYGLLPGNIAGPTNPYGSLETFATYAYCPRCGRRHELAGVLS